MEGAVEFEILRREAKQVIELGRAGGPAETVVEIVAAAEERSAGAGGEVVEYVGLIDALGKVVLPLVTRDLGRGDRFACVVGLIRLDAACVKAVDHDLRAYRAIEDVVDFAARVGGVEAGADVD